MISSRYRIIALTVLARRAAELEYMQRSAERMADYADDDISAELAAEFAVERRAIEEYATQTPEDSRIFWEQFNHMRELYE